MNLYYKTIITISIVLINTLVILKNKKLSTKKFLFLIIINSFFATILLLNNHKKNKYIKYSNIENSNYYKINKLNKIDNYDLINCNRKGVCQISENNFNLLPSDLKKLAYNNNKNINCNTCNLINMPKCPFNNMPSYIKFSNRLENDIPDIITPNIPDGTLMNGLEPLCKVKNDIVLENSKDKSINIKSKFCPHGFQEKKNGICRNIKKKYCLQANNYI